MVMRKPRHTQIQEGRDAFLVGIPRSENPYVMDDQSNPDWKTYFDKSQDWDQGWRDEQVGGEDPIPE
jgi:hypothetical protein